MTKRIQLSHEQLSNIQSILKDRGYTLDDIKDEIGADFRNFLYKNHSIGEETIEKLESLLGFSLEGQKLDYIDVKGKRKDINIPRTSESAELIGIILGDGYIQSVSEERDNRVISAHRLVITLHENEKEIISNTKTLINSIIGLQPSLYELENQKTVQIALHSIELIEELINLGLQPGNKKKNQVNTPKWIKEQDNLMKSCLRGLLDTDGTVYTQSRDNRKIIQFKNHSAPLLEDFSHMCRQLGISTSNGGEHVVQIANQEDVEKFLTTIQPIKSSEFGF